MHEALRAADPEFVDGGSVTEECIGGVLFTL